jgi:PAS domain S-box-containing protein
MNTELELEKKFMKSTSLVDILLGEISDGVIIVDDAGMIRYANQQVELIFGWDRVELIGQTVDLLLPPGYRQVHLEHLAEFLKHPERKPMGTGRGIHGRRVDGSDFPVEVHLRPFSSDGGTYVACLFSDISSRAAPERRLQDRFDLLFRAFPVPTYIWQRQGDDFILIDYNDADKTDTNAAVRRYLGRSYHFMYPEGGEVAAGIERCYRERSRTKQDMLGTRMESTGEVKDLVVMCTWIEPDLVVAAIEDVTADRAALSELKRLSSAVDQTADAVFITDRNGTIEYVNPGFELMTGYPRAKVLGQTPRILKSGEMPPEYYRQLWSTILRGEPFQSQTVNHRADGTKLIVEQTITPMRDQTGQVTHFVSVLKDMTERIRLQEQETENRLTGKVQRTLFPKQPPQIEGYDIAGAVFPASNISGDYFDYIRMADNTIGIVVGDVCGHGMGPALFMSEARAYLRSIARYVSDPRRVLSELHSQILPDIADTGFITMFLACLDPDNHVLDCANAGNWPAYILNAQGKVLHELYTDGVPIGVSPTLKLRRREEILLEPGGIAVFLTDGIPEATDGSYEEFGADRMLSLIKEHHMDPAQKIIDRLREEVLNFMEPTEQADDQTIVICKRVN